MLRDSKLSRMLPKYLELSIFLSKKREPICQFLNVTKERTNLTHSKSVMLLLLPNKKAVVYKYHNIIFSDWWYTMQRLWNFCCCIRWVFEWWITSTKWWTWYRITPQKICCSFMEIQRSESLEAIRKRH